MSGSQAKSADKAPAARAEAGKGGSAPATARGATSRKSPAAKEVPPFQWKLVGYSHGIPLTLLKSAERGEVEGQLERYQAEGYYNELAIHPIDAKIPASQKMLDWISQQESARAASHAAKASASQRKSPGKQPAARKQAASKSVPRAKPKAKSAAAAKAKPKVKAKKKTKTKRKPAAKGKPKARAGRTKKASAARKKATKRRKTRK